MKTGQRPDWDHKGKLEEMGQMVAELKARMENSNSSNDSIQAKLTETQGTVRILEDDKTHLAAKLASKCKETEDLEEDLRKLRRQMSVKFPAFLTVE
jgi:chromosome segregation ATPase